MEVGYCKPPLNKQKRFSTTYQPEHNGRPKGPSILTEIRHILEKKITYTDPDTRKKVKGKVAEVIAIRHILNATQGDHNAITDILDRIDGKPAQKIEGEGFADTNITNIFGGQEIDPARKRELIKALRERRSEVESN